MAPMRSMGLLQQGRVVLCLHLPWSSLPSTVWRLVLSMTFRFMHTRWKLPKKNGGGSQSIAVCEVGSTVNVQSLCVDIRTISSLSISHSRENELKRKQMQVLHSAKKSKRIDQSFAMSEMGCRQAKLMHLTIARHVNCICIKST